MRTVGKILVVVGTFGALVTGAVLAAPSFRVRKRRGNADSADRSAADAAGVMFVGAVDEVELGPVDAVDVFDPAEVPSDHPEINELRSKMPFG
jgi:hypothetical protein